MKVDYANTARCLELFTVNRIGAILAVSTTKVRADGVLLKAARVYLGLDQNTLAAAAHVARPTLSSLERRASVSHEVTRAAIQSALERRGIVFTNGDKPGFYFDKAKADLPS